MREDPFADVWASRRSAAPTLGAALAAGRRHGRAVRRAFDGDRASPPAGAHPRGQEGAARRPYKAS